MIDIVDTKSFVNSLIGSDDLISKHLCGGSVTAATGGSPQDCRAGRQAGRSIPAALQFFKCLMMTLLFLDFPGWPSLARARGSSL